MFDKHNTSIRNVTGGLSILLVLFISIGLVGCNDKGGGGGASSKSPTSLSGIYESKQPDVTMTYEFMAGNKFKMTAAETGGNAPETAEGTYTINGDLATLQVPGGIPVQLTIKSKTLEGSMMGQIMIFTKK